MLLRLAWESAKQQLQLDQLQMTSKQEMSENSEAIKPRDGKWTEEEHRLFLEGLRLYGRNWKLMEKIVTTRSGAQIRSHAQKFFNKLDRHREIAWNPDNSSDLQNNKGRPRLRSEQKSSPEEQDPRKYHHKNGGRRPQNVDPTSYPQYLSHQDSVSPFSGESDMSQSFWASHIQPLLINPNVLDNFIRMTTAVEFTNNYFRDKKRKDSAFTNLHEDETETGRIFQGYSAH